MQRDPRFRFLTSFALSSIISVVTVGCAPSSKLNAALIDRLAHQGPLPLSRENTSLAQNLLLTKISDSSTAVRGFLNQSGDPASIEVTRSFLSPLIVTLNYPQRGQFFTAEEAGEDWIILGPFPLGDAAPQPTAHSVPPLTAPTLVPAPAGVTPAEQKEASRIDPPANSPLAALVAEAPTAELPRTPEGDGLHTVSEGGETIGDLALWYTIDPTNADRIRRTNRLPSGSALVAGQQITIPIYMLRNSRLLPPSFITRLRGLATPSKEKDPH